MFFYVVGKILKILQNKNAFSRVMTAACEASSQYYKMITKFSVLDIKNHLPIFATMHRYFYSMLFSTEKLLGWQIDC